MYASLLKISLRKLKYSYLDNIDLKSHWVFMLHFRNYLEGVRLLYRIRETYV